MTVTMIKIVRDRLVANRPAQRTIRAGARHGLIPPALYNRVPVLGQHPVRTPAGNRIEYLADPSDMLARQIVWGNLTIWEATSLRAFSQLVRNSRMFVDVGAYTGIYSLIACADGAGNAIAFEPNPEVVPMLRRNVAANSMGERITVIAKAASSAPGSAVLSIPDDVTGAHLSDGGSGPRVELTTVDEALGGRQVDVIKIDVEGFEPDVIAGAELSISTCLPAIITECLDAPAYSAVKASLTSLGYDRCRHLGRGGIKDTASYIEQPAFANFLWTSSRRRDLDRA